MHVFVDEAGIFVRSQLRKWAVSCVGALVVPDDDLPEILERCNNLKNQWGAKNAEIKGSKLGEREIAGLSSLLRSYDVIFQVTAIDMQMQAPARVTQHRLEQAEMLKGHITDKHHPNLVKQIEDLQDALRKPSNQLYVQAVVSVELLYRVLQNATLYYAQRKPKELGSFQWVIDAKDRELTRFEDLWRTILLPFLQSKSLRKPFIQLQEADYSSFEEFCGVYPETPDHLKAVAGKQSPFEYADIGKVFRDHLRFEQSRDSLGLQVVDAIRRAMNGNLQPLGWQGIGPLTVQAEKDGQVIQLLDLSGIGKRIFDRTRPPYLGVIPYFERTTKPMLKTYEGA